MGYQKSKRKLLSPGFTEGKTAANPLGGIQASELAPHVVQTAIIALTAAQLIAMNGTPVSLIPAPGAGYALVDVSLAFEMITTSTQFTGGGAVSLAYHGGSVNPCGGTIAAGVVTAAAGTSVTQVGPAAGPITVPANTGIDITNATAAFATGTGTAKAFVRYRVIAL